MKLPQLSGNRNARAQIGGFMQAGASAMTRTGARLLGAAFLMTGSAWASAAGNAPPPAALRKLEAGQWELRERAADGATRRMCVADIWQLMQVQHPQNGCSRFVVSDEPDAVAVTYDCARAGNGRTDLRVETNRLVQIRSQGIARGAPFALSLEGRRIGACS